MSSNKNKEFIIPEKSLRFRIVANSNSQIDQNIKNNVKTELLPIFQKIHLNSTSLESTKESVLQNLNLITQVVEKHVDDYDISLGNNYFPQKTYHNVVYQSGNYDSLVITLGDAVGDNWWCVLFPPLCLLEAQKTDLDKITYESYFQNIIKKYL